MFQARVNLYFPLKQRRMGWINRPLYRAEFTIRGATQHHNRGISAAESRAIIRSVGHRRQSWGRSRISQSSERRPQFSAIIGGQLGIVDAIDQKIRKAIAFPWMRSNRRRPIRNCPLSEHAKAALVVLPRLRVAVIGRVFVIFGRLFDVLRKPPPILEVEPDVVCTVRIALKRRLLIELHRKRWIRLNADSAF
jgi:hypothetical protein